MERPRHLKEVNLLVVAVLAVSVASPAGTAFALWYVAACATLIVVVINLLVSRFLGFVN
jgi:hypothetical protein